MRKIGLALGTLLISVNCFAASVTDLKSALNNSTNQTNSSTTNSAFIYGGKDISKEIVATANESLWAGEKGVIG